MAAQRGHKKAGGRKKGTRNKVVPEMRLLARQHGAEALLKLVELMRGDDERLAKLERKIAKVPADSDEMGNLLRLLVGLLSGRNLANELGAAKEIIDRGWGKPAQPHTGEDGEGPVVVEQVTHRIIYPKGNGADDQSRYSNGGGVRPAAGAG